MNVLVIDGQGGKMGRAIIEQLCSKHGDIEITAVGTNSIATANMLKGGPAHAATGENPVVVASLRADVIIGPIGITIADSMYGEITDKMALAVAKSRAVRILLPVNKCDNLVAGVKKCTVNEIVEEALNLLYEIIKNKKG